MSKWVSALRIVKLQLKTDLNNMKFYRRSAVIREWDGVEILRSLLFGSSDSTLKHCIWFVFHIVKLTWHVMIVTLLSYNFLMNSSGELNHSLAPSCLLHIQLVLSIS